MESVLTLVLVSVILGTCSGAQNLGSVGAFGVGGYIALAGLWGSPVSGASMNTARTLGPDLVGADLTGVWVYLAGPLTGALLAVVIARVLRGRGGRARHRGGGSGAGRTGVGQSQPSACSRSSLMPTWWANSCTTVTPISVTSS